MCLPHAPLGVTDIVFATTKACQRESDTTVEPLLLTFQVQQHFKYLKKVKNAILL